MVDGEGGQNFRATEARTWGIFCLVVRFRVDCDVMAGHFTHIETIDVSKEKHHRLFQTFWIYSALVLIVRRYIASISPTDV